MASPFPHALVAYAATCDRLKCTPNKALLDYLDDDDACTPHVPPATPGTPPLLSLGILDLSRTVVGDLGVQCIAAALPHLPGLRVLALPKNGVGNGGCAALCAAMDRGVGLQSLDLRHNLDITRAGGQALLTAVARCRSIVVVLLAGTRVTEYYQRRVERHAAQHFAAMPGPERDAFEQLLLHRAGVTGDTSSEGTATVAEAVAPVVLGESDGAIGSPALGDGSLPDSTTPATLASVSPSRDQAGSVEVPSDGADGVARPAAPTNSEAVLTAEPADSHPEPYNPEEYLSVLQHVHGYTPKTLELPFKLTFPGSIDYIPAVHAPDPLLAPPMPAPLSATPEDDQAHGLEATEMYWNFFGTAATVAERRPSSSLGDSQLMTPSPGPGASPDSVARRRRCASAKVRQSKWRKFYLARVPDVICATVGLSHAVPPSKLRRAQDVSTKPLAQLLTDPGWSPCCPTRGRQVDNYLVMAKLNFNGVSVERFRSKHAFRREFFEHRALRHGTSERLTAGSINAAGTRVATTNYDKQCRIWDAESGALLHTLAGHTEHLSECMWNAPQCDRLITASFDHTVRVWDVATAECLHVLSSHSHEVICVAATADGNRMASGGADELIILWDVYTGQELCTCLGHASDVTSLDFSPDGTRLASCSHDESVRLWNTADGTVLHVLHGHTAEVMQVRYNCFGNMVVSCSADHTCRLWDTHTGNCKVLRGHGHQVLDVTFSPSGWQCASASDDSTVRVWDVLTGGCVSMMVGHNGGVSHVVYNHDGTELLTGSLDHTAKLWSVDAAECKQTFSGHKGIVLPAFSADSTRMLTVSKDNACRVWRLEPPPTSLAHAVSVAICQHPTMYREILEGSVARLPHITQLLEKVHRRLYTTDALAAPRVVSPAAMSPSFAEPDGE